MSTKEAKKGFLFNSPIANASKKPDIDDRVAEALAPEIEHTGRENKLPEPQNDDKEDTELDDIKSSQAKTPAERAKAKLEEPTPIEDFEYINLGLPGYVMEQLRIASATKRRSSRFEILRGLKRLGYEIRDADLVPDRRRGRKKKK